MKKIFPAEIIQYSNEFYWTLRNIKSNIIYTLIIFIIIITFLLLPFIKINVSTQSLGVIRTINENNSLQSVVSARIDKVNIKENKYVKKGDTIVYLNADPIKEQVNRLNKQVEENLTFITDIKNILEKKTNIKTSKYISEYNNYKSKMLEQDININKYEYEYMISKNLYDRGVESKFDLNQNEKNYQAAKAQFNSTRANIISGWEAEVSRLEIENRDLISEIKKFLTEQSQYYIIAPINGFILKYSGVKNGNYLVSGQIIGEIASNDSLLVESYIYPADISYIQKNQNVKIQVEAFDYRQWGLLTGKVVEIGSDVITIENKPFFKVLCQIDKDYMTLGDGHVGFLKKGMRLTCRFELTEKSLAQLLFDKLDNRINPTIINETN